MIIASVSQFHIYLLGQRPFSIHPLSGRRHSLPAASSGAIPMLSLGYQRHKWPKLKLILTFSVCCRSWPGLPEPPSLRSRSKQRSHSFRALPASKTSSVRTCGHAPMFVACCLFKYFRNNNKIFYNIINFPRHQVQFLF